MRGIAIQHCMAFQGEYFVDRYGKKAAEHTSPIVRMLAMDILVRAGTDATRVASYNPFVALYWLVSGKTVGGTTSILIRIALAAWKRYGSTLLAAVGFRLRKSRN